MKIIGLFPVLLTLVTTACLGQSTQYITAIANDFGVTSTPAGGAITKGTGYKYLNQDSPSGKETYVQFGPLKILASKADFQFPKTFQDQVTAAFSYVTAVYPEAFTKNESTGEITFSDNQTGALAKGIWQQKQNSAAAKEPDFIVTVVEEAVNQAKQANQQIPLSGSTPLTSPVLSTGQYIVALNDDRNIRTNANGWVVEAGEIYKFSGYTNDGLLVGTVDDVVINASPANFITVPEKDIAQAAMKYADQVEKHKRSASQNLAATDGESLRNGPIRTRGDWPERSGAWRGPDGSVISNNKLPQTVGPFRVHRRAVDHQIEAMICQRDSAIASGRTSDVDADAQFNQWLANKRQEEAIAASTNEMNQKVDDANRKLEEQNRRLQELQRKLRIP